MVDLICRDTAAFIGPEGPNCHTEAMVAGSKNRAMISYRCTDAQIASKEKYPTFTRMEPPDTQGRDSTIPGMVSCPVSTFSLFGVIYMTVNAEYAVMKVMSGYTAVRKGNANMISMLGTPGVISMLGMPGIISMLGTPGCLA
jgi:hypothetical protein